MTRAPLFAWTCLVVWTAWLFALQGLFVSTSRWGPWAPDVGLLLLLALVQKTAPSRARWAAVWIALGRIAFSADPPLAILAGYLGFVGVCHLVQSLVELERPLVRALLAGAGAAALAWYWTSARSYELEQAVVVELAALRTCAWPSALATAMGAMLLASALARLPGLSPLHRRRM